MDPCVHSFFGGSCVHESDDTLSIVQIYVCVCLFEASELLVVFHFSAFTAGRMARVMPLSGLLLLLLLTPLTAALLA